MVRIQNVACGVPVKSQQTRFKIHAIAACVLAEICVILRIFSKVHIHGKLGADDYFIIIAGVSILWQPMPHFIHAHSLIVCDCSVPISALHM